MWLETRPEKKVIVNNKQRGKLAPFMDPEASVTFVELSLIDEETLDIIPEKTNKRHKLRGAQKLWEAKQSY